MKGGFPKVSQSWEGEEMPNRDGKGPRKRSPRPSVPKGGLKKGKCK